MAILLTCDNLCKTFGPRLLFSGISISFAQEERIGLIGPNGAGKSTLLRILAGLEHADSGEINTKRNLRLEYVPQEETFVAGPSVEQVMLDSLAGDHIEPHEAQTRVAILLHKIGFERPEQPVEALSGGWRKRLSLARRLLRDPELLLLDEPTNHLDLDGIAWLEELLADASFSCIMVSHDRYFLENCANRTVELSRAYPLGYLSVPGTYSDFVERRQDFMASQAAQQQAVASRVRREIEWLRRGAKARTTKAKGRIESAGRMMDELAELKTRNTLQQNAQIDFAATDRQTRKLLQCKGVSKSLGGRSIFSGLDLVLSPGTKLGLAGPNGSGKTTLIRLLAGELPPDGGEIRRAEALRIVCCVQAREQLDRTQTLRQSLLLGRSGDTVVYRGVAMHVSGWARRFLFDTQQLDLAVADLSGGEQARVLLARLMLRAADVLILDEPTNDLDIATLEVLEESLEDFPGALVLVTHDRYMLDRLCTGLIGLDGLGGHGHYGSLLQYQRAMEQARAPKPPEKRTATALQPKPAAAARRLSWSEQRELEQMEGKIHEAEAAAAHWQEQMSDPAVLADHARLTDVCHKASEAAKLVVRLYARWEELEAKGR
jgi:ABC transport system ATP-binding/permease protein